MELTGDPFRSSLWFRPGLRRKGNRIEANAYNAPHQSVSFKMICRQPNSRPSLGKPLNQRLGSASSGREVGTSIFGGSRQIFVIAWSFM